ncbi:MAG: response regulator [Planctomycetaceae bacterium]|nr:response regulator [Planctomycetaceae bacterium]
MTPQPVKPRVLIVDDRPANRLAFEMLLAPMYSVYIAGDGREALELTRLMDFAVILLDVRMPGMDGFEVAEQLRKSERTAYTPIIFMSAYDRSDFHAKKGYVAGATDYIFSPVDEELLKYKVATYVQIFLRNEALWQQVTHLKETVRALEKQLSQVCRTEEIEREFRSLESQIEALKDQLDPLPR